MFTSSALLTKYSHTTLCASLKLLGLQAVAIPFDLKHYTTCKILEAALREYISGPLIPDYNALLDQLTSASLSTISCVDCKPHHILFSAHAADPVVIPCLILPA